MAGEGGEGAVEPTRELGWLAAVALLALALRLLIVVISGPLPPLGDGVAFEELAARVLEGRGMVAADGRPTAHRPPLQVAWLALVHLVLGTGPEAGPIAGALLGTALAVATGLLAGALGSPRALVLGVLAAAVYPRFLDYGSRLWSLSELLAATTFTLALAAWAESERAASAPGDRRHELLGAAAAGFALGLAALARPVLVAFPALFLLAGRRRHRAALVAAILAALTLLPWTLRNQRVFGRFVPVSSMGGIVFYQGFHPPAAGWGFTPWDEIREVTAGALDEVEASDVLVDHTLATIAARPLAALRLLPLKLLGLLQPFSERTGRLDAGFVIALGLGLAGAWALRRDRASLLPRLAPVYVVAQALVFYGSPRFRFPIEPVLVALAVAGAEKALAGRAARRRAILGAVVAVVLALVPGLDGPGLRRALERVVGDLPGLGAR